MKRYFDIHDKKVVAMLDIKNDSCYATAKVDVFKGYFNSTDVRELTLSQYRRLKVQYDEPDSTM